MCPEQLGKKLCKLKHAECLGKIEMSNTTCNSNETSNVCFFFITGIHAIH